MAFDYLNYKNKIPVSKVKLETIPSINPLSVEYSRYWKDQKRKCIEGMWVNHDGIHKWVPGSLYFYVNHWHILLNEKGSKSKTKSIGRPFLRDLEWIKNYVYVSARGFSGFEDDDEYTCHRIMEENPVELAINIEFLPEHIKASLYSKNGMIKRYKPALEYLYEEKSRSMGKALFNNMALNIVDIESRGGGKSYTMSALCAHNFLFDGAMDYDEYLEKREEKRPLSSETLVGASDSKYSTDLINKIKLGLENLPGGIEVAGVKHPSPLSKSHTGSWESGKTVIQQYQKKVGGKWEWFGTKSKIQHRTFKDNPFAANGTRPGFMVLDEVGFMGNLEPALGQIAECTADGAEKFGTVWMTGTGGDMEGGATEAVKRVFYDPKANSCLMFDDIFEHSPYKIGFFIPAWMTLNQYKDEFGNTDKARALHYLQGVRAEKQAAKSKKPINDELQQRPLIPSEAFLVSGGNIFDRPELGEWIGKLETMGDGYKKGLYGDLYVDSDSKIKFKVNLSYRPCDYPVESKDDLTGCIVIWDEPIDNPPYSYYIASLDPYAQDEAPNSQSLGSMQIFKRSMIGGSTFDEQVAEYTGRPATAREFFENCRKLLVYYNATCLYENNYNAFKEYMQNRNSLHYLAYEPTVLKPRGVTISRNNSNTGKVYGLRMHNSKTGASTNGLKDELEIYTRDWLYEDAGDGSLNLHHIYSVPLLKELKAYNDVGNFDRAISLMLIVALKKQLHQVTIQRKEDIKKSEWATRTYY